MFRCESLKNDHYSYCEMRMVQGSWFLREGKFSMVQYVLLVRQWVWFGAPCFFWLKFLGFIPLLTCKPSITCGSQ